MRTIFIYRNKSRKSYHCYSLVLLLLCCLQASAQHVNYEWAKSMGGTGADQGLRAAVDGSGNVYVTGRFAVAGAYFGSGENTDTLTSAGSNDVFLAKYDASGTYQWARSMGGTDSDIGYGVAVDGNGNVYVGGVFAGQEAYFGSGANRDTLTSAGGTDVFIAKYDANGNFLWVKSMGGTGGDQGWGVAVDGNGNAYVTGVFHLSGAYFGSGANRDTLTSAGNYDVFVAKYDANGTYQWAKSMGGTGIDYGYGVAVDGNGNVYVTGYFAAAGAYFGSGANTDTLSSAGGNDVFVARYDANGTYQWARSMGGTGADFGQGIAADGNGNVYVAGYFAAAGAYFGSGANRDTLTSSGGNDVFVARYDANGTYQWARSMGGTGADFGQGVAVDGNGNVYVTGYFSAGTAGAYFGSGANIDTLTSAGGTDVFVAKYDTHGTYGWAKSMGGTGADQGWGVAADGNGNVYGAGYFHQAGAYFGSGANIDTLTSSGGSDVFVFKLSQGCRLFTHLTKSACDSFIFSGVTYTSSGVYVDTFILSANCDSIVTLDLTITGYTSNNPVISGHYCDSVTFNGVTYTHSGTYVQQYTNSGGCDSNITYELTIGYSNSGTLAHSACNSFEFEGTTYTTTGIYQVTLTNASGCDSTLTLDLTIDIAEASVVKTGTTLTAHSADSYQWVNCDNNTAIPGATNQSYTITQTGNYAVIIVNSDCSDTSDCIFVEAGSGINELGVGNKIQLYPNPTDSRVTLQTQQELKNATFRLINVIGQVLEERTHQQGRLFTLDMMQHAPGIYFVEISERGKIVRLKVVRSE